MGISPSMHAMVLEAVGKPLIYRTVPVPDPAANQVLVKILACGVCRTDLHITEGELTRPELPLIPGHEVIGIVVRRGDQAKALKVGDLVGIPWMGYTCGTCRYCLSDRENLCENALFTGYTMNGGYAEYMVAFEPFCIPLPPLFQDLSKASLLCAGLIGYRAYRMIGDGAENIGFYGFGAAAQILIQIARHQHKNIYAFTRDGDLEAQDFARKLGASWAGGSTQKAPLKLDASIIFASPGYLVPKALEDVDKGGVVICGGIHMSDIPSFPYDILWEERSIRSIANLTRKDATAFLGISAEVNINTQTRFYPLEQANSALADLKNGKFQGAAVLVMDQ